MQFHLHKSNKSNDANYDAIKLGFSTKIYIIIVQNIQTFRLLSGHLQSSYKQLKSVKQ